ncbi:MAG: AraC family transcriptional regulator [Puia sp.]|nr:AraC family transcriptional regulator [Puia sp.]
MPVKNYLQKIDCCPRDQLQTLVENRRIFNLNHCELNVFETNRRAYAVPLQFGDFVITSMVRGKKVMHLPQQAAFDYLPGESVIVPANERMVIDFPEAEERNPTQCIALAIDAKYIHDTLYYLRTYYNHDPDNTDPDWKLQFNQYHFNNETEVTDLINKLVRICSSQDRGKNIYADLGIKELLIRILQSQHLQEVMNAAGANSNAQREHFVVNYIQQHLTEKIPVETLGRKVYLSRNLFFHWFKEQFGFTPLEYINRERIKLAKQLLSDPRNNITATSFQCGFSDVNYFVRIFRKMEGITPKTYQSSLIKN